MPPFVIDGLQLEIEHIPGPEGAAPVLWLHEGLGSVSTWRDFPRRLCEACARPGVVYSRAGYGRSAPVPLPRPLDYMQREAQVALPKLIEHLGLERVVLFGHSDGASIALVYAGSAHGRARTEAVITEAPHVFVEPITVEQIAAARQAYLQGDLRARLARHHEDVDGAFWGWNRAWLDPDFTRWSIEAHLPGVSAPSLHIQCARDPYGTLAQLDRIERGLGGPSRRLVLNGRDHAPHRLEGEAVIEASRALLEAL